MKLFFIMMMLATPVFAHDGGHEYPGQVNTPEMSAEHYVTDYVNHGFVTCYGRAECIGTWDIDGSGTRMVVPQESQQFFRHPYDNFVTTW